MGQSARARTSELNSSETAFSQGGGAVADRLKHVCDSDNGLNGNNSLAIIICCFYSVTGYHVVCSMLAGCSYGTEEW